MIKDRKDILLRLTEEYLDPLSELARLRQVSRNGLIEGMISDGLEAAKLKTVDSEAVIKRGLNFGKWRALEHLAAHYGSAVEFNERTAALLNSLEDWIGNDVLRTGAGTPTRSETRVQPNGDQDAEK